MLPRNLEPHNLSFWLLLLATSRPSPIERKGVTLCPSRRKLSSREKGKGNRWEAENPVSNPFYDGQRSFIPIFSPYKKRL